MKENGMNKLIKLLNEYGEIRKYNNVGIIEWVEHTKGNLYWKHWENTWSYMVVISKEYGFIQRLVDNDKIDFDKLKPLTGVTEIMLATNYPNGIEVKRRYRLYEQLIMLLSISDNPIDFLISILKDKKVRTVYVDKDGNVSGDTKQYSDCGINLLDS